MAKNITVEVPFDPAIAAGGPVRLLIEGLQRGRESLALRIFVDDPAADARTPIEGNSHYAGTLYVYGHGQSSPNDEAFSERAARQRQPYDQSLDVTTLLKNLAVTGGNASITVVPVDLRDNPLSTELVRYQRMTLVADE